MNYILENNKIKITINSLGAELKEIYNKENNLQYLWDANPNYWKRCSPILFPNVGKYYNGKYRYNGKEYNQSQHGFARDMEFELLEKKDNYISFVLNSNEQTLIKYPFEFSLVLAYELIDNEIKVYWTVKNTDNKDMYFSIGGHPAFNVPLKDEKRSDCYLYFKDKNEIINSLVNSLGYATNETVIIQLDNGYLKIEDNLFDNDALVIEKQGITEVSITDKNKKPYITVKMNCPLFGVWSISQTSPFVCIEPWYGRCDIDGYIGSLENREYQNKLESNKEFNNYYSIVIE